MKNTHHTEPDKNCSWNVFSSVDTRWWWWYCSVQCVCWFGIWTNTPEHTEPTRDYGLPLQQIVLYGLRNGNSKRCTMWKKTARIKSTPYSLIKCVCYCFCQFYAAKSIFTSQPDESNVRFTLKKLLNASVGLLDMDWEAYDIQNLYITASPLTVNAQFIMSFLNRWENLRNRDNYTIRFSGLDADTYKQNKELKIISMFFFVRSLSYLCVTRTMNLKPNQNASSAFHVWLFRFDCKWLLLKKQNLSNNQSMLSFFVPFIFFFFRLNVSSSAISIQIIDSIKWQWKLVSNRRASGHVTI